jgi:NitT/TauT family transport system substrate-binding protein
MDGQSTPRARGEFMSCRFQALQWKARNVFIALATLGLIASLIEPVYAQTKIVEGYVSEGALQWPEYVAKEKGWFKENNVDIEMIPAGAGVAQQLAAGALDIGYTGCPDFMLATDHGAPIKIFMNAVKTPPYGVFAKPTVKKISDLKGKIVSVGGSKDVTLAYIGAMLASENLKPSDVDYVYAKATPDRLAALMSGGVDAAILYPPATFKAAAAGYTNLGDIGQYLKDFPFTVWAVNTNWAKDHRDALLGYLRAYSRAVAWLYDEKNKSEAVSLLVKYAKQNAADAAATYDYFIKIGAYSTDGVISPDGYKAMVTTLVRFGDLHEPVPDMSKFVDDTFVKAGWRK